jgi:hypothetical protein
MLICFGAAAQPNAGQARSPQERAHHNKFADSNKPAHPNKFADPNRLAQHSKPVPMVEMRMFFDHAAPIWNSTRRFPQPV